MICRKCNGAGSLFIRKEYCYCNDCFITNVVHKFRACIGKNKSLFPNEKVLICLSGNANSTVLLDLIFNSITLNSHKKLKIIPYFLHITEAGPKEEIILKSVLDQCMNYNFHVTIVNIREHYAAYKSHSLNSTIEQCSNASNDILLKVPLSIKQDIVAKIKQNIFIKFAKELKCRIIFTAETTTVLASKLLSNIVIGRGSQIENEIGFADERDENVKLLRPMREISNEEIEHYIKIKLLKPDLICDKQHESSLQSIIKNFILDLQSNSPATVSTVCKTADKIGSTNNDVNQNKCVLCQSNIEVKNLKLTAVEATMFSKEVSLQKSEESGCSKQNVDSDNNLMFPLIFDSLCYCCSRNVSELDKPILQFLNLEKR